MTLTQFLPCASGNADRVRGRSWVSHPDTHGGGAGATSSRARQ